MRTIVNRIRTSAKVRLGIIPMMEVLLGVAALAALAALATIIVPLTPTILIAKAVRRSNPQKILARKRISWG